ncbi:RagB/SusD family nutrient uptake outer membrane protein [uncultured Mediterranea sp.]|uniref:RagB/SusD family nutrient uptake outer membrane protein n=1 Tax=uncultured Mediterranea sp. TaxID=1926662 RepID=UPI0027D939F2|nr:RagB/SusD family nutrient uptake outer membrane protein [uncultured Mediterranea sp.]
MKKKHLLYSACFLALASLSSCENFLDKEPLDKQTNDTYWQTETSLRTYAQDFYSSYFEGYGTDYTVFGGYFSGDDYTDDFINLNNANTYSAGYIYFPTSATTDWNSKTAIWSDNYSIIYKANVMIEKIPGMDISEEAKNHWTGVAKYFRAMAYSALLKAYGGVPYVDKVADPADPTLYKDRDSYLFVAQKVLEDFQYTLNYVRNDDTKRQVNRYVVGAYMSRELLYHATWLKYHGTTVGPTSETVADADIKELLQGAINGADAVMSSGLYKIGNTYNALFTTDDLANNPEIIWYREYTTGLQCNALMSYNGPEDQTQGGVTQNVIESYLCTDGLPIGQSPLYEGKDDPSIWNSFKNRAPRLYQTVADSLRIMSALGTNYSEGTSPTGYATKKFLNDEWLKSGSAFCTGILSPADAPCFRYAEVLLNYVEARYEIARVGGDAFTQEDLNKTINQLRQRQLTKWGSTEAQTMPQVQLGNGNITVNGVTINDPARDPEVDPVLWEIRRERRIELIMEGRRGEDLRRWAKFEYLNSENADGTPSKTFLGAYVNVADYEGMKSKNEKGDRVLFLFDPADPSNQDTDKGYINYLQGDDLRVFKKGDLNSERYYLRAIPAEQITVYKDNGYTLTQTPGW